MVIFETGASGYIGSAVADALIRSGHAVKGLAHTDESARRLEARSIQPVRGSLFDASTLIDASRQADGVIHLAQSNAPDMAAADLAAVDAIIAGLAGSDKPLVYTQGAWDYGETGMSFATEESPMRPLAVMAWRPPVAGHVQGAAGTGIRSTVIRPANVYGHGGGLLSMMTSSARQQGAAQYIGTGENVWSMVHVDDLAALYQLALAGAPAGSVFNAAGAATYQVRELAEAASRGAGADGRTASWPVEDARRQLGDWVEALTLNLLVDASKARRELGWAPSGPNAVADLLSGSYASVTYSKE